MARIGLYRSYELVRRVVFFIQFYTCHMETPNWIGRVGPVQLQQSLSCKNQADQHVLQNRPAK